MKHVEYPSSTVDNSTLPHIMSGSEAFMEQLRLVSADARELFYVQAMTFEGDTAGEQIVELMSASPARDKLLVVDGYSDVVVNDSLLHLPPGLFNKSLWDEHRNTQKLLKHAHSKGIRVAKTNPVGAFYHRYPFRNHKKSIVVDNWLFVGGINFSDHNFEWYDMMMRFDSALLSSLAAHDILSNAAGMKTSGVNRDGDTTLVYLNRHSEKEYAEVFEWIRQAKHSITVYSPYISEPFLAVLKQVSNKVRISIMIPEHNNKGIFSHYLKKVAQQGWFQLYIIPKKMSHVKAILIDDRELIAGSSNFDFISYLFEEELLVKTSSGDIVREFLERIHTPLSDLVQSDCWPKYNWISAYIPDILWKLLRTTDPKSKNLYSQT
jgi:cardiolipin synthase A/B